MMNPFRHYIERLVSAFHDAEVMRVDTRAEEVNRAKSERKVLLFSPHPDDECITGLLPLRLMRESKMDIINIPMTFGSDIAARPRRAKELQQACDYLGWTNYIKNKNLENVSISDILEILIEFRPEIMFFPHELDWNSTHERVHSLVKKALEKMPKEFQCLLIQTEYWSAMRDPNMLVQGSLDQVAELTAALSLHKEEVARNPYHLTLPAWMQDNVRRGAELVGEQGAQAPRYTFGTIYKVSLWRSNSEYGIARKGSFLSQEQGNLVDFYEECLV